MASSDIASPPTGRVLAVLDLLAAAPDREFTLTEIVVALGINKATCHAIVTTMAGRGYLVRSPISKGFTLGSAVVIAGRAAEQVNPAIHIARTVVPSLARELEAECVASVIERDLITVVEWAPAYPGARNTTWSHLGQHIPLVAPFGATHIAWSPPEVVSAWIDRSSATFDQTELRQSLDAIRVRGYDVQAESSQLDRFRTTLASVDLDQLSIASREAIGHLMGELGRVEYLPVTLDAGRTYSINALAASVFDATGSPVLTVSVHPASAMSGDEVMAMGRRLRQVADGITDAVRGRAPAG